MEKQIKISNSKSLKSIIDTVIKEGIKASMYQNALKEREKQHALQEEDDEVKPAEKTSEPSKDETSDKLKKGDVSTEDIVDKLNLIRSGKSLKDEEIAAKMDEYVKGLTKPERIALLSFLKGLTQIITGEIPADDAADPSDSDANISMEKDKGSQKVTIKPTVIKAPDVKSKSTPSAEDTSGPVPITPKKK